MGQTSVGRLHGRLDVLQTLLVAPPSWIQDGGAGNDINQDLGRVFRSLLRGRCKMATLPLPAAILDDLICGTGNEVIQDGRRKRKGRHFAPPPQWGSKNSPYTTADVPHRNMNRFKMSIPCPTLNFQICPSKWQSAVNHKHILLRRGPSYWMHNMMYAGEDLNPSRKISSTNKT